MSVETLKGKIGQLIEGKKFSNGYFMALSMLNITFRNLGNTENLEYIPPYDNPTKDNFDYFCQNCSNLKIVESLNTSNSTSFSLMFSGCVSLVSINNPLDFSKCKSATAFNSVFAKCQSLATVSFVPQSIKWNISFSFSSLLSDESIQSIIDGLATVETQQKLTLHTDVVKKLTQEQKDAITAKNWIVG